ncbi:MAG: helix-turn-helix transcriptional regulator [Candidatus Limnocylindrales bacterium]
MRPEVLTSYRMSPRSFSTRTPPAVADAERRLWIGLGVKIKEARLARQLTDAQLALKAAVSPDVVYLIEAGRPASTEAALRLATSLGRRLDFELVDPRRRAAGPARQADLVHSAMGEVEAGRLRHMGFGVGVDEPYQHYQFAGRADIVAWDLERAALLHIENRTRFPDFQEMAGSYNAKRAYLGAAIAERLGLRRWASETHVMAALWSAEVLHALRLRRKSFRSLCPDSADTFHGWWTGDPPRSGVSSSLVVFDPIATGRQRPFVGFEEATTVRSRHRGYADVARLLESAPR